MGTTKGTEDTEGTERRAAGRTGILSAMMVLAAVATGFAIQLQDGEYTPVAMVLITLALLAGICAVVSPTNAMFDERPERRITALQLIALVLQFAALFLAWPGVDLPHRGHAQLAPLHVGLAIAFGLIVAGHFNKLGRLWFPLLLTMFLLLGMWMVHSSPRPVIDVWEFQQRAADELLHGRNPYAMTFPDIYHSTLPGHHQQVYGSGLVLNDRLQFGFPYPPVSFLLAAMGYAVAGDHRYAQVVGMTLAGLFIGSTRRGQIAMLAAALLLFTPRIFFVLARGWTEPFVVMLLAATIYCACRRSRWLPVALGLFLATKQYLIFAVPLTFFLLPTWQRTEPPSSGRWRAWFDLLWKTALVAAVVTLPFVFWDYRAFWKSTVTVQELSPFRWDALSYLVWYGFRGHLVTQPFTAFFWSTLAATAALALSLWRAPRTPAGFAAALALLSLAFFAFNKQAFCNYYFFAIGAMCCAIAASDVKLGHRNRVSIPSSNGGPQCPA